MRMSHTVQPSASQPHLDFAQKIVEYLKTRYHTEAPHISVLSPEYAVVVKLRAFRAKPTLEEQVEEGEGDFIPEALAELLDPTKIRGHATHGVVATFRNPKEDFAISMETSFFIRKAPPTEFKKVNFSVELRKGRAEIRVVIEDEQGKELCRVKSSKDFSQTPFRAIFAVGWPGVVSEAANIISKALYPDSTIIELSDDKLINALSTAEATRGGQIFRFSPSIKSGVYTDSQNYFVVQNFLYEIEIVQRNNELKTAFVLRYIAPALIDREKWELVRLGEPGFPTYAFIGDRRNRWSVQHLLEVESKLRWKNVEPAWSWEREINNQKRYAGLHGLIPIGALAVEDHDLKSKEKILLLRDWHIEIEKIYPIRKSRNTIAESFRKIGEDLISYAKSSSLRINEEALRRALDIVAKALKDAFPKITNLHEFQEKALYEGLKTLIADDHKAFVLQARTAGGKTLAFLLPILVYITYTKLAEADKEGVKALLFYPTTALQNDQAATVFRVLWHVNCMLYREKSKVVSLGMLHGHTPKRDSIERINAEERELRLRCPLCGQRLVISWEPIKGTNINRETIKCSNDKCQINDPNSLENKLLQLTVRGSRDAIYSSPPDLLIANPDIINARLTLMGSEDPASLTVLGKPGYICKRCGYIHDSRKEPRKCCRCGASKLQDARFTYPKIVVIDEAHLLRGAFGAQVSHVLTRLEQAIRKLNSLSEDWRPIYFISSATLNNPGERAHELIATDLRNIAKISAEHEETEEPTQRIHVFVMPKLYSPEATTARIVEAIYLSAGALPKEASSINDYLEQLRKKLFGERKPAMLIFVNRISEANELLSFIRSFAYNAQSDGHTTDYQADRVRVEDEFSRGNLDILVATSGLEVGVDFDRVDVGIIYGMPFYISDYTQRIGRIGRHQHSIIFNVFMPDKPIDYFYYRNYRLLSDGTLRDMHMRSEAYRINRENPEAVRRSAHRVVLDMLSMRVGASELLNLSITAQNRKFEQEVVGVLNSIESEIESYLQQALKIPNIDRATNVAKQFVGELRSLVQLHGKLSKAITKDAPGLKLSQLRSLRTLEPEVRYKFNPINEERSRDMMYAFRHALPGQIISYRGNFYAIETSLGEDITTSNIRGEER